MQVTELSQEYFLDYETFLANQDDAMLYHTLAYKSMLEAVLDDATSEYRLAVDEDGRVRGCLPLFVKSGPLGDVCNSLPFYGSHGGVIADCLTAYTCLLDWYNERVGQDDVCASTWIANLSGPPGREPPEHDMTDYRIGQVTSISYPDNHRENLMASFHQKTRNMIRKAEKSGFRVEVDNDSFAFLHETHIANLEQLGGKAKPGDFFESVAKCFSADKDYRIYVASLDGQPAAALLLFYYKQFVEYYVPVVRQEYRNLQPISLIVLQAMADASQSGYRFWNWGGTWATQDGVYRFKSRFAADDQEYSYFIRLNNRDVLGKSRDQLLEWYADFFVVPFDKLEEQA